MTAVITTQLRRARETAQPFATARGLTPEVVPGRHGEADANIAATAAAVRRHAGEVVLVVGHSNTIPGIIAALGGPQFSNICASNLFILVPGAGDARFVQARYGAADAESRPECR